MVKLRNVVVLCVWSIVLAQMLSLGFLRRGCWRASFHVRMKPSAMKLSDVGAGAIPMKAKKRSSQAQKVSAMNEETAATELAALNAELAKHAKLYFENNAPEISDAQYDKLVLRAEAIIGRFQHLAPLIPQLNVVGMGRSSKLEPFHHSAPMLSLAKSFNEQDLTSFFDRVEKSAPTSNGHSEDGLHYSVEPKIDGLSLALVYERTDSTQYCLKKAGTRGDGTVGEDVTANVLAYMQHAIPSTLSFDQFRKINPSTGKENSPSKIEVRGEVYLSKEHFRQLNQRRSFASSVDGSKVVPFATARNAAAGALRKLKGSNSTDSVELAGPYLQFYAYSLLAQPIGADMDKTNTSGVTSMLTTQSQALAALATLGFKVAQPWKLCTSREQVLATCREWNAHRGKWEYDADGAVVKVDEVAVQEALGSTGRYPRWAMAFKYADDTATTILKAIEVTVGRTGVLTPVALLEPVSINGVIIERATLHNEHEVNRLGLRVGDKVILKRAGDVIPKILGLEDASSTSDASGSGKGTGIGKAVPFRLPASCPECGSPTERLSAGEVAQEPTATEGADGETGDTRDAVTVRCTGGAACPAQVIEQISHFCSRDAANIDGLGRARIEDLFEGKYISSVLDVYRLRQLDLSGSSSHTTNADGANGGAVGLRGRKGWGDRSVNHLLAAVDKARHLDDHRFLFGLGIRHIGQENAKLLTDAFQGFPALWAYLRQQAAKLRAAGQQFHMLPRRTSRAAAKSAGDASVLYVEDCAARLQDIHGVGPRAIEALLEYASAPRSVALVQGLMKEITLTSTGVVNAEAKKGKTGVVSGTAQRTAHTAAAAGSDANATEKHDAPLLPLSGRVVVFTGKLTSGVSRSEAEALCVQLGGSTRSSINKSVNLLVQAGDVGHSSNKAAKAGQYGIEVWSEQQWNDFVALHMSNR